MLLSGISEGTNRVSGHQVQGGSLPRCEAEAGPEGSQRRTEGCGESEVDFEDEEGKRELSGGEPRGRLSCMLRVSLVPEEGLWCS